MSTLQAALPVASHRPLSMLFRIFMMETKTEFLALFRTKSFSLAVVGFPVMFYVLFGVANKGSSTHGVEIAKYMLAGYCCFAMVSAALFGIGVGLASERSAGWLELKRSSPMPPIAYLLAKCVTAQAFGSLIIAVLICVALAFGGVHLSANEIVALLLTPLFGTVPFAAMGLLLALVVPANAAGGVVNLINLPLSFMSGMFIPIFMLPKWVQGIAPYLPTYHLSQLVLSIFGYMDHGTRLQHATALAGYTLVMLGIGWAVFQRAEQNA